MSASYQQLSTLGQHFTEKFINPRFTGFAGNRNDDEYKIFFCKDIRSSNKTLANASTAMTRLADMKQSNGQQVEHYE